MCCYAACADHYLILASLNISCPSLLLSPCHSGNACTTFPLPTVSPSQMHVSNRCLAVDAPGPEEKLTWLSDIAQEHSVEWDAHAAALEMLPADRQSWPPVSRWPAWPWQWQQLWSGPPWRWPLPDSPGIDSPASCGKQCTFLAAWTCGK